MKKIFIPNVGDVKVNIDNVSIEDFGNFGDVIIDDNDTIIKIRVYDDDFNVIHSGKGRHDIFADDGNFELKDWPEIDEFIDWAFDNCPVF